MPTKKVNRKKTTSTKKSANVTQITQRSNDTKVQKIKSYIKRHTDDLLSRRPHRTFKRTRRRDYVRSLKLPGYWSFTNMVRKTIWQYKKTFLLLMTIYAILTVLLIGLASQDTYTQLGDILRQTSGSIFKGDWGQIGQASLLLITGVTGDLNASPTEGQQIYAVILVLFSWLTTVWMLRAFMAGKKPKLRDGFYNAGAPIIPTFLIVLVMVVQLIPVIVAILAFTALMPYGILDGGIEAMIFWFVAFLLVMLSMYWMTSSFMALIVVTLPGMYPMKAITIAGDLVIGRRIRIMLRLLWMIFVTLLGWIAIMVPIIIFDAWLKGVVTTIAWLPIVPVALLVMGSITVVWIAAYIYLLYRRIVDDDVAPA